MIVGDFSPKEEEFRTRTQIPYVKVIGKSYNKVEFYSPEAIVSQRRYCVIYHIHEPHE